MVSILCLHLPYFVQIECGSQTDTATTLRQQSMYVLCWPYGVHGAIEMFMAFELKTSGEQLLLFCVHRSVPKSISHYITSR